MPCTRHVESRSSTEAFRPLYFDGVATPLVRCTCCDAPTLAPSGTSAAAVAGASLFLALVAVDAPIHLLPPTALTTGGRESSRVGEFVGFHTPASFGSRGLDVLSREVWVRPTEGVGRLRYMRRVSELQRSSTAEWFRCRMADVELPLGHVEREGLRSRACEANE